MTDRSALEPVPADLGEVRRLLASGDKVRAVATYRERTGADLVTAKNQVDRLEHVSRPPTDRPSLVGPALALAPFRADRRGSPQHGHRT